MGLKGLARQGKTGASCLHWGLKVKQAVPLEENERDDPMTCRLRRLCESWLSYLPRIEFVSVALLLSVSLLLIVGVFLPNRSGTFPDIYCE